MPNMLSRLFVGSVAGETAAELAEKTAGLSTEELDTALGRGAGKGVFAAAGGGIGRAGEKAFTALRGGGALKIRPETREAQEAFSRLGVQQPTPGQASESPIIRRLESQSGAVGARVREFITDQEKVLASAFQGIRDTAGKSGTLAALRRLEQDTRKRLIAGFRGPRTDPRQAGDALRIGVAEYDKAARQLVDTAYSTARGIEEPRFNIIDLQAWAQRTRVGVIGRAPDGEAVALAEPEKALLDVLKRIEKLDPSLPPTTVATPSGEIINASATDQLRAIRSDLFDLSIPSVGPIAGSRAFRRGDEGRAAAGMGEVDKILNNPLNTTPAFRAAWREAQTEAAQRFRTLESAIVVRTAKATIGEATGPTQLARMLAKPGQVDNLKMLRSVVPGKRFKKMQEAFQRDLTDDPDGILSTLDSFDTPTLRLLISPPQE